MTNTIQSLVKTGLFAKNGAPGEIRTPDQVVRSHLHIPDKSYINQLVAKNTVPLWLTILVN